MTQVETDAYVSVTIRMIQQQEEIDDLKKQLNAALEHNALLEKALINRISVQKNMEVK